MRLCYYVRCKPVTMQAQKEPWSSKGEMDLLLMLVQEHIRMGGLSKSV